MEAAGLTGRARSRLDSDMALERASETVEAWRMRLGACCPRGATPEWRLMGEVEILLGSKGTGGGAGLEEVRILLLDVGPR